MFENEFDLDAAVETEMSIADELSLDEDAWIAKMLS